MKMNNTLSNFERSLLLFDDVISSRVLDLALLIAKQALKNNYVIDSSLLLNNIKKIFNEQKFSIKNPVLFVNSKDKLLIEEQFGKIFKQYQWSLRIDDDLSSGDFLISSKDMMLDSRMSTYWHELFQLAFLKKK